MKAEEVRKQANQLVTQLEQWHQRQDRGMLARLRRGLSETTRSEADMVLGQYFGPLAVGDPVYETVAGCFALHPFTSAPKIGNFGETMRVVMGDKISKQDETHARFRRLLACSDRNEVCQHVRHAIRLAKSKEAKVNYRKLYEDLWWWNDWTKVDWAKAYWSVPADATDFALAGIGAPVEEEPVPTPE
jgi:CRISPR type I-E-associated protein CasB/Cse2